MSKEEEVTAAEVTAKAGKKVTAKASKKVTAKAGKKVTVKELTVKELTVKELTAKEVTATEVTAKEVTAKEVTAKEVTAKDAKKVTATEVTAKEETNLKSQRKTTNLGHNTVKDRDEWYAEIEKKNPIARCSCTKHEGDRFLPVRKFYRDTKSKSGIQSDCIACQTIYRGGRSKCCRDKFEGKNKQEICDIYLKEYGQTKTCSICKTSKHPSEFPVSISMETGIHNQCILCSIGNRSKADLRDFIFMPDKDGIKYKKKDKCERCSGTDKLAVDHILPIAKGGTDCIPNKQTLCVHCNSKKSDTIDCVVKPEFLSVRYQDDSLDFSDNTSLSQILSKKVYEFRRKNIDDASLEDIRNSVKDYAKKYNLGHNLDRIVKKIDSFFKKSV